MDFLQQIDTLRVWNKRDPNCPKDAVYVGRPTKWGNPYKIGRDGSRLVVIESYRRWLEAGRDDPTELRGKDLVCWCAPQPCHADILLEVANALVAQGAELGGSHEQTTIATDLEKALKEDSDAQVPRT